MWLDQVSNPGPLALESDALQTALLISAVRKQILIILPNNLDPYQYASEGAVSSGASHENQPTV